MTAKTFEIQVHDDHLARLAQVRKPILAVAEMIWNSVDADADEVIVTLTEGALGGLESIQVRDDGHGIPYAEAEAVFSGLGGSWKQGGRRSREKNRILHHGKEGRGRFRVFGLGRIVDWSIVYKSTTGELMSYRISMIKDHLKRVDVSEEVPAPSERHRGVTVTVSELDRDFRSLRDPGATDELAQIFALYLRQYPGINITFDGTRVDPRAVEVHVEQYALPDIRTPDGGTFRASIEVVEWKMSTDRRLYFCDVDGFPLHDTSPGIQAPGFSFTAYLKSDYFSRLVAENRLEIADLDPPTASAVNAAKEILRDHFRRRSSERAAGLVEEWRRENIYPYQGNAASPNEEREREVFNVVALNVNHFLPDFQQSDEKSKRFQLRLLRHAIQSAPADLARILTDVLDLPPEKRQELAGLLDHTTLAHIISASKVVSDRLEFLRGLETLVFDKEFKNLVRERAQLHRIVAENAWMFGEQYHLSVDDQSLTEVLKQHLQATECEVEIDEEVRRPDGSRGIVDLMFSRNIQIAGSEEREHLVVELKRPSAKIDGEVAAQIESYAFAVADDERFRNVRAKWVFWAISNDMDTVAARKVAQKDRPRGILFQSDATDALQITIWLKTWSQVINECRARLRFFAEKLNYTPDRDSSLSHLKTTYQKYLADLFAKHAEREAQRKEAATEQTEGSAQGDANRTTS